MVMACVGFEPKTFRFSLEDKKMIGQSKYIEFFFYIVVNHYKFF